MDAISAVFTVILWINGTENNVTINHHSLQIVFYYRSVTYQSKEAGLPCAVSLANHIRV